MFATLFSIGMVAFAVYSIMSCNSLKDLFLTGKLAAPHQFYLLFRSGPFTCIFSSPGTLFGAIGMTIWYIAADETRLLVLAAASLLWIAVYANYNMLKAAYHRYLAG